MATVRRKLVTIVAPASLEDSLVDVLGAFARGVSIVKAHGHGTHGDRPSAWYGPNLQVEVLVSATQLDALFTSLERFLENNPMVAWVSDVEAWPADKFV